MGALGLDDTTLIFLDMTIDKKGFTLLSQHETRLDMFRLYHKYLHAATRRDDTPATKLCFI
jgi:hypothetical protein